jgi:hypothetical protein
MLGERGVLVGFGEGVGVIVLVGEAAPAVGLVGAGGWVGGTGVPGPGREHPKAKCIANNTSTKTPNSFSHFAFLIAVLMLE